MRLEGKVAIVTGGAQGIGLAIVRKFAEEGATVIIGDISAAGAERAEELRHAGKNVHFVFLDVTEQLSIARFIALVFRIDTHIDILVNNAGILRDNLLVNLTAEELDHVYRVNQRGPALMTKAVVPNMSEGGVVLNASSVVAGGNFGQTAYCASKGAVEAMTVAWAREFAWKGIRVNAVAPGFTATEMVASMKERATERVLGTIPTRRLATPEEIANAYCFLASDEASYVNGAVLAVDGACIV